MASNRQGVDNLKAAYQKGYESFFVVEKNERGFYINPPNPFIKGTLTYKEYIRGYNKGFTDNKEGRVVK